MNSLLELAGEGKYHQLSMEIQKRMNDMSDSELHSVYTDIIIPNYYNLYPDSLAEISSSIAERLDNQDALELLEKSLKLLLSTIEIDGDTSLPVINRGIKIAKENNNSIIKLLLDIAHKKLLLNDIAMARVILYECKDIQMESKDATRRLHLGMGLLYYTTKNYFPAFKNLLEYLEISPPNEEIFSLCLRSGILSDKIYSFTRFIAVWKGSKETNEYKLACSLEQGTTEESMSLINSIDPSLASVVEEKGLTIKLINYFFSNHHRAVSLIDLSHSFNIPIETLEKFILNILGSGLMKGSINGIKREFVYTWIGHKHLTNTELSSVRQVITELKNRVAQVQQEIASESQQ
ncbi:26S proteasome regulatory subunit N9 [Nematocida sp. AWRm80]|nr:26S proteasome regulatory subunit N9 [Nematocida sp. AWRm80]